MSQAPVRRRLTTVALAACAGVTAVAGVAAGTAVPALAASTSASAVAAAPTYLTPAQLPQGARFGTWTASGVVAGLPNPRTFCLKGTLPVAGTHYKKFAAKPLVFGEEYVTVAASESAAEQTVATLKTAIQGCYRYWLETVSKGIYKGKAISASWARYATYNDIADGLTVFGVFTVPPKNVAKPMSHMFSVGRDGNSVTVVHVALPGTKDTAPVERFTTTSRRALNQLS